MCRRAVGWGCSSWPTCARASLPRPGQVSVHASRQALAPPRSVDENLPDTAHGRPPFTPRTTEGREAGTKPARTQPTGRRPTPLSPRASPADTASDCPPPSAIARHRQRLPARDRLPTHLRHPSPAPPPHRQPRPPNANPAPNANPSPNANPAPHRQPRPPSPAPAPGHVSVHTSRQALPPPRSVDENRPATAHGRPPFTPRTTGRREAGTKTARVASLQAGRSPIRAEGTNRPTSRRTAASLIVAVTRRMRQPLATRAFVL